ncbi:myelin protein zero-like protein 3 [Athene cunicularia]|uniref:myelin protein zero-like protein 3 n=1 Tax=Athene cunicularia TaxID=194338 RepID=UPI000EF66AEF|nr:myelin protein zero-like protein 3 [Athene cunicularia]
MNKELALIFTPAESAEQVCSARNLHGSWRISIERAEESAVTSRAELHAEYRCVCNALSLEIKASPKVRAFIGEQVSLKCSFKSSSPITESLTVDWTYRPLTGGQMETIFHYQSVPYPTTVGKFKDRISWIGNVARGDASVAIESPVMSDNGTFICSVKNPPDVYHNIPQTVLIVTERGLSFQLTSAVLLSILVFLPSIIVVVLLLVRMGRKFGVLKEKKKSGCKKSSIEVSDEPEHTETDNCLGKLRSWCLNCVDTDEEDPYW